MSQESNQNSPEDQEFQEEYKVIKSDVKRVVITNVVIILLLLAAFFVNRQTGFVNKLMNLF